MIPKSQYPAFIKNTALEVGFDYCGISKSDFLEEQAPRLENWLRKGMHGEMQYMTHYFDMRLDPRKLVEGSKSVISVLLNYYPEKTQEDDTAPKLSKYAYGKDYHFVIKDKLSQMVKLMQNEIGQFSARVFTDSAPIMDKVWAQKSGLGWIGKHSNLLNKKMGSFFFIGEIICDLELEPDGPVTDHCGTCTKCIDACPTDAITGSYIVDGSKCISYATIELKAALKIPDTFKAKMENWAFGCDICQDVCPWNRFSTPNKTKAFDPHEKLLSMTKKEWKEITEEVFNEVFKLSPVQRPKYNGLMRNLKFLDKEEKNIKKEGS
jgi:epoxyqueuosine reductase